VIRKKSNKPAKSRNHPNYFFHLWNHVIGVQIPASLPTQFHPINRFAVPGLHYNTNPDPWLRRQIVDPDGGPGRQ
jgi:hypothetical protein